MQKDLKKWYCQMCGSAKNYFVASITVWTLRSKDTPLVVCAECHKALEEKKLIVRGLENEDTVSLTTEGATTEPYRHDCGAHLTKVCEPQLDVYEPSVMALRASTSITYWLSGRRLVTKCPGCHKVLA